VKDAREPQTDAPGEANDACSVTPTLEDKLEAARREYEALQDKYLRLLADFENHKKRAAKEREQQAQFSNEELLKEWLPVVDNVERAARHAATQRAPAAMLEGLELILKQCREVLGRAGATAIEAIGQPFDPQQHQAIAQRDTDEAPAGTVVDEAQRGYLFKGRLLRPALVTVAKQPQS